jgi:hypothetical protein
MSRLGWVVNATSLAAVTPWKRPGTLGLGGWVCPGPVWTGEKIIAPVGIRSPDRAACGESLYRFCFPGQSRGVDLRISFLRWRIVGLSPTLKTGGPVFITPQGTRVPILVAFPRWCGPTGAALPPVTRRGLTKGWTVYDFSSWKSRFVCVCVRACMYNNIRKEVPSSATCITWLPKTSVHLI